MKFLNLKKRLNKIILGLISLIAFIFIVILSGRYSLFPGRLFVTVNDAIKEVHTDNGAAIIDSSSKRAIIIDTDGNCTEVLKENIKSGKATYYSMVSIIEDRIYIGEYDREENNSYLTKERIVEYTLDGEKIGTLFEFEHTDDNRTSVPFIQDIIIEGDKCQVLLLDAMKKSVSLMSFTLNDPIFKNNIIDISTPIEYPIAAWFSRESSDSVIVCDKQSILCMINISDGSSIYFQDSIDGKGIPLISADIDKNGSPILVFKSSLEGTKIYFNTKRISIQIIFWLCCVWLGAYIVFILIRKTLELSHQKNNLILNKIFKIILIFLLCLFFVGFYSVSLLKSHAQNIENSLEGYAAILYNDNSDLIDTCLLDYKDDGILDSKLIREVEERFEKNVNSLSKLNQSFKFALVYKDNVGESYIIGDSSFSVICGEKISENYSKETDLIGSQTFSSRFSTVVVSTYSIKDGNGDDCGYLVAYQDMGIYIANLKSDFLRRTILLVSILIIIGFAITEGKNCVKSLAQRKRIRISEETYLEPLIVRPICFFSYFTASVNTTLLVVILKEIVESKDIGEKVIMISFAAAAINSGFIFGGIIEKKLMKILPEKLGLQLCSMISIICYAICYISIINSNILLFTLALFISNVFQGAIDTYCRLLAFYSTDRQKMNNSLSTSWISGSAIAGVTAGILASLYGNSSIQILGMITGILTLVFITLNLPSDLNVKKIDNHKQIKSTGKDIKRLLTDPKILSLLICVFIPIALFSGYKSYIFPYVAYESGISKSTISSVVNFFNALFFYTAQFLVSEKKKEKYDSKNALVFLCIIASTVFILFYFNVSVIWMVIAIAVSTVVYKISDLLITTLYQKRAIEINTDKENANIIHGYFENSICGLCTPVVLECFLQMMGFGMACFTCGAIGVVGVICFLILNKKKKEI